MANTMRSSAILVRYGALGVPLAFASIPLYVHVPALYAGHTALGLTDVGLILLLVRIADMIADPFIGSVSDRYQHHRHWIMVLAVPVFALGFLALFSPPGSWTGTSAAAWLAVSLVVVYAGFSTLAVNYYAWGVALARTADDHTRVSLWREAAMLIGVLFASLLPTALSGFLPAASAYRAFGIAFALLLPIGAAVTLWPGRQTPREPVRTMGKSVLPLNALAVASLRWALLVTFLNALPVAVTSTLFLFFVSDVLQAPSQAGYLLALYFSSAVLGMPLWSRLSHRYGKSAAILVSMFAAILFFAWAGLLGAGDVAQFYVICFFAGLTLGADTVLIPALYAVHLDTARGESGAAFGWWHFLNKAALAIAAGTMLPLLALGAYVPEGENGPRALALLGAAYAFVPCGLKALAAIALYISPLHRAGATANAFSLVYRVHP